ncbi:MAG: fibronectin type III domain-containing protein [Bryobacteraceae bacterium]
MTGPHRCLACLAAALLGGCGYTGDPLPPALMIPEAIEDLRGFQRGGAVWLQFTVPQKTTEDLLLKAPPEIELRAGENPQGGFDMGAWLAQSGRLPAPPPRDGTVSLSVPAASWVGKEMVFGVRTRGPRGKASQWSNLLVLRIVPPPVQPHEVRAEGTPEGIRVTWAGDGARWRVFRRAKAGFERAAEVEQREWLDRDVRFGQTYEYAVEQVVETGAAPAVSERTAPVRIAYEDRFPPAPPTGLRVVAGTDSIELNWDRNHEEDLRAYQVWRAEEGGELKRLGEPAPSSTFTDRTAVPGRRYRYAVSAIDEKGNESRPCEPVEIVAP